LNLLLHLGSGLLVYRILTRAVTEETRHLPFWAAALFLLHPIQTETVTYISGRASGLMAFFYLFAFFLYSKASERPDAVMICRLYLSGSIVSLILSLGSKETAATFPLALLLWDLLIRRLRGRSLRTAILFRHVPFWGVLLFAAGWAWSHPRYAALAQFSLNIRPLWDNLLSESHAAAYALTLFFTPWNQNFDHDLPVFHSLAQWPLPLDILLLATTAGACLLSWRRFPLVAFGLGWFFVQLLPTSLIPRNDLLSERNLYLASIGVLLVLVFLGSQFTRRLVTAFQHPRLVPAGAGVIAVAFICCLCIFTYQRNALYRDPVLLWSDTVEKSPQKARPHNNLGHAYLLRDDWERAIEEFRIAVQLDPDYALARKNLRDAYLHQVGRP
jgi:tetratricopeptide (TPR) repeat protein